MKRLVWGVIAVFLVWMSGSVQAARVYILCYHTFLNKPHLETDFSISEFDAHISELQKKGFRFVQWKEVVTNKITGDKNILLVIDDGNVSTYPAYTQVLKPRKIKPMLAIYPGITGSRKFALNWQQLSVLRDDGLEIASHGYFHMYFSQAYHESHPKEFLDEIFLSKRILEQKLGISVTEMVYPFGVSSAIAKKTIREAGYRYAFSLRQSALHTPISPRENLDIPRFMITRSEKQAIFARLFRETQP